MPFGFGRRPPQPPPQQQAQQRGPAPTTNGPCHAVPCPHCGAKQDFRELLTTDGSTIYSNMDVSCDECGMFAVVTAVQQVTVIHLRPENRRDPAFRGPASQRKPQINTISPAQARRLLR
jgi:hypothetical protein